MPSVGHVFVGLAAGRWYAGAGGSRLAASATFVALSTFPDLDFMAHRLGALAGSPWLHRGALHALSIAAIAGLLAALLVGGLGRARWAMALAGALGAASHGLLDTLTGGGAGVMLLWPANPVRHLAPWTWMPAALTAARESVVEPRGTAISWVRGQTGVRSRVRRDDVGRGRTPVPGVTSPAWRSISRRPGRSWSSSSSLAATRA